MGDYKDCPLWQDATKAAEQWEKDYEEGKKDIEEALELALGVTGKVLTMLKPKIRNAAELYAELQRAQREARVQPLLQPKVSREGNVTMVSNPIHDRVRTLRATYDGVLKDLGLVVRPEKVETNVGKGENTGAGNTQTGVDEWKRKMLEGL